MPKATIDIRRCTLCHECLLITICPANAITRVDQEYPPSVEKRLCHGCGDCVDMCPENAITIVNNE